MVEPVKKMGTFSAHPESHLLTKPEDEKELVSLACSGSRRAFEVLVARYQDMVFRLAYRFFANEEDAMDVTQEVFLKAFRSLKNFEGRSSFKTWLYRIASNTCLTVSQERQKQKKSFLSLIVDWFTRPGTPDPGKILEEEEYQRELQEAIREKIARIPDVYRLPVILKDIEGKSLDEISEILELKEGTVKSRINRGRKLLQEALEPFYRGRSRV
jgi:RNA polymerase sigma-70 factor (ECF subfamily)